jgi:hypothetical protein
MTGEFPPEPSADNCENRTEGTWNGRRTRALWYPSMGGYVSKAVAVDRADGDGPDVYVWHDGEFPFTEGDRDWDGKPRSPAFLHLCDPDQFIGFGQTLADWLDVGEATR